MILFGGPRRGGELHALYGMVKTQKQLIEEYKRKIRELEALQDAAQAEERRIGVEIDFPQVGISPEEGQRIIAEKLGRALMENGLVYVEHRETWLPDGHEVRAVVCARVPKSDELEVKRLHSPIIWTR